MMDKIGWGIFCTAIWFPGLLFRGYVLKRLFNWFAVPSFHVFPISSAAAYGLGGMLLLAVYVPDWRSIEKDKADRPTKLGRMIGTAYVLPAISLLFGWGVQSL